MVKHGSTRRSTQPLQGMLLVILVVLAACLDAGRVVAWSVEEQFVDGLETLLLKAFGKLKGAEKFKDALEGFKVGRKGYKTGKKLYNLVIQHVPEDVIDAVSIGDDPNMLPVVGVDIGTWTVAPIGCRCAAASLGFSVPSQPISLYGRWSSTRGKPIESLGSATLLHCPWGGRSAVLGFGLGGELAGRATTFSYFVVPEPGGLFVNAFAWFGQAQPGRRSGTPLVSNLQDPRRV